MKPRCILSTLFLTSWYLFHEHRKQHIWHPTWKRLKAKSTKCEAFRPPHTRLSRYICCLRILKHLGTSSWAFFIHVLSLRLRKALLLLNDQDGICVRYKYETAFGEVLAGCKVMSWLHTRSDFGHHSSQLLSQQCTDCPNFLSGDSWNTLFPTWAWSILYACKPQPLRSFDTAPHQLPSQLCYFSTDSTNVFKCGELGSLVIVSSCPDVLHIVRWHLCVANDKLRI